MDVACALPEPKIPGLNFNSAAGRHVHSYHGDVIGMISTAAVGATVKEKAKS